MDLILLYIGKNIFPNLLQIPYDFIFCTDSGWSLLDCWLAWWPDCDWGQSGVSRSLSYFLRDAATLQSRHFKLSDYSILKCLFVCHTLAYNFVWRCKLSLWSRLVPWFVPLVSKEWLWSFVLIEWKLIEKVFLNLSQCLSLGENVDVLRVFFVDSGAYFVKWRYELWGI